MLTVLNSLKQEVKKSTSDELKKKVMDYRKKSEYPEKVAIASTNTSYIER